MAVDDADSQMNTLPHACMFAVHMGALSAAAGCMMLRRGSHSTAFGRIGTHGIK